MEEEKDPSPEYIKAFNAGYQMQKHNSSLLDKILKSDNQQSEAMKALASGKQQHEREKTMQQQQRIKEKQKEKKPNR